MGMSKSAATAHLLTQFSDVLSRVGIDRHVPVAVALSGGSDSLALALLTTWWKKGRSILTHYLSTSPLKCTYATPRHTHATVSFTHHDNHTSCFVNNFTPFLPGLNSDVRVRRFGRRFGQCTRSARGQACPSDPIERSPCPVASAGGLGAGCSGLHV